MKTFYIVTVERALQGVRFAVTLDIRDYSYKPPDARFVSDDMEADVHIRAFERNIDALKFASKQFF